MNKFLLTDDRAHLRAVPDIRKEIDRWLGEADRLSNTPREDELVARAMQGYERFFTEFERLTKEPSAIGPREEVEQLVDQVLSREILEPVHEYLDFNELVMGDTSRQNQAQTDRMVLVLLLLGMSGAVAGLIAGFGIARGISRSIVQLTVPIRDAAGRLNVVVGPITVTGGGSGGSFEELGSELRRMVEQIGTVVERLQQTQREVQRAEQLAALGQLAAGLAHELRNPLMSVKLLAQSATERYQSGSLRAKDLTVLEEVTGRLEESVRTFLDFAKPPRLEKSRIDLVPVIDQTTQLLSGRAEQQGVQIECDVPSAPVVLDADALQIRQVLLNLLMNAMDAMPKGGVVRIEVAVEQDDDGREPEVSIRISDTGCGLPAELGDRIFEPFVSSKETGIGLGLSISQRIVEAHRGHITATNRPAGGALLEVWLPAL